MRNFLLLLIITVSFVNCKQTPKFNDPIPKHDSLTVASKFVNEDRRINVWTPPIYETSQDSLPVLYMPDGGTKEDFPHVANTLAKLIKEKKIPPFILVGIENTERWRDLTGASSVKEHEEYGIPMTDGAVHFRKFITDELFKEINSRYRTTNRKGIIGESLAGLFVVETFFKTPEAFNFFIAFDPSIWWDNNSLTKNAETFLEKLPNRKTTLWFAGSGSKDMRKFTKELEDKLKTTNPENVVWTYSDEPNEEHSTIFRATKEKAITWAINN